MQPALCYTDGCDPKAPADLKKAFEMFRKSAELGYGPAQVELAGCYISGAGVAKDEAKAVEILRKASGSTGLCVECFKR
jgi:TPR repeat protein